ncbi:unnamed protein product [Closterium sp. NIES-54]
MGYEENATKASGVTEQKRRRALGQAMDGQVMLWFVRRMWRGVVLEAEPEREKPVREVQKMGAWATIPVKDEAEWVIGDTMGKEEKEALQAVLAKFRHAFAFTLQELEKCTGEEMELKLTSNEPVFQRKRRKAPGNKDLCKEKCKELLEAGLIQRSESEYATPTVIAARKDLTGEVLSRRMCGDYRALNRLTVPDRYPMPTAEEIFDKLGEGEIFSTLDLRQGFNQIRIKKEDVRKIAFHGADGLYEWLFMPFGLRNASAIFQRVMDSVLRGLECAACYIDDVVIFSKMEEEHVRDVERTLEALSAAGLTCHPKKCRWGEATVQYLGYEERTVGGTGVSQLLPTFCAQFQQASSGAELPVKGGQEVGVGSRGTLRDLMEAVQTATVLELPQADKPFALYTDWSSQGMGAILCQELDGEERVVAYASVPESLAPLPRSTVPPCTPCVDARQRAAPHSSSFPPTIAPLQNLHLDVWGPSRVLGPRQERYFLIVVDDYCCYTTVFPLRRKADVLTVLGPLLIARGGVQGLCGLRLHSDRGVRYAAHQLNLWPSDARPRVTPIFLWTGWVFYDPVTHRFFASQDVTFDESVSYYRSRPHRGSEAFSPPLFLTLEPPPFAPVAPPPSRPAPSGVSHVTPQSSPPHRLVPVVSGGAGGAVAEDEGTGAVRARRASSGGAGGVRVETTPEEDMAVSTQRPRPTSPPGFPSVPQFWLWGC